MCSRVATDRWAIPAQPPGRGGRPMSGRRRNDMCCNCLCAAIVFVLNCLCAALSLCCIVFVLQMSLCYNGLSATIYTFQVCARMCFGRPKGKQSRLSLPGNRCSTPNSATVFNRHVLQSTCAAAHLCCKRLVLQSSLMCICTQPFVMPLFTLECFR